MTRVRKDPEVRQAELMDAALSLFNSTGYEKNMVVDIVKKAGVAKGTFFYYFPTKEAVLEALCTRWAKDVSVSFKVKSRQCSALFKLQRFIEELFLADQLDILFEKLVAEEQLNLLTTLWKQQLENVFNPLLMDMIQQGTQEGSMHVCYEKEMLTFFWSTIECLCEAMYEKEPAATLEKKAILAKAVMEELFGIERGTFNLVLPPR